MGWILFLVTSFMLLVIAAFGTILNKRNLLVLLLCVEMIFLAANVNFVLFSRLHMDVHGQIMALFVMVLAAAESAIALALMILMYRKYRTVNCSVLTNIRG